MQRWGTTVAGTIRWRCFLCKKTGVKKRPDHRLRRKERLFKNWLTGNATLHDLAKCHRVSIKTIRSWFKMRWREACTMRSKASARILIFDATHIDASNTLLVTLDAETNKPNAWGPATSESCESWMAMIRAMPQCPTYAVCDGHPGLIKALYERWPEIRMQRCLAHIIREMRTILTRKPKLAAGKSLKALVSELVNIKTRRQKRRWIRKFFKWLKRFDAFLKERTMGFDGRRRYTHRSVRRGRSHLLRALPDMFRYISDRSVPSTSNQLEGGINSPLKDLIRKHRGMSPEHELVLMSLYLKKRAKKPTRNFH